MLTLSPNAVSVARIDQHVARLRQMFGGRQPGHRGPGQGIEQLHRRVAHHEAPHRPAGHRHLQPQRREGRIAACIASARRDAAADRCRSSNQQVIASPAKLITLPP